VKKDFIDCSLDNKKMGLNCGLTTTFFHIAGERGQKDLKLLPMIDLTGVGAFDSTEFSA
jgi:hypothetical protein